MSFYETSRKKRGRESLFESNPSHIIVDDNVTDGVGSSVEGEREREKYKKKDRGAGNRFYNYQISFTPFFLSLPIRSIVESLLKLRSYEFLPLWFYIFMCVCVCVCATEYDWFHVENMLI